ncbi:8374_t:CDS:2 [Funneliformis geosporum]|uniref:D-arabinono-1,4-lactone oxidase n=1 Tax=Funneliformis geosporum TaxID=1117311 RepID=A0A9W4WM70_9GLOM|nr:7644_t:CDS:2 [Funneliformis geosporum]CAI2173011.1 8374_t:CDS:2 [Funneliformis geosporum]
MTRIFDKDWQNWSGNQKSTPTEIFRPKNLQDIKNIIELAKKNQKKIRCSGSGHTWSSLSVTNDYLVLDEHLNKIDINFNEKLKTWTVTTEPGVYFKDLDNALSEHQPSLTLNSATVLDSVTTGGVVAAGCHGARCNNATISDKVISIQIVTSSDGELHEFSDEIDPEEMSAARINLGLLGIIYKLTFEVEPMYSLEMIDTTPDIATDWNASNLKNLFTESDSLEIFYWPFNTPELKGDNDKIWIKQHKRTQRPVEKSENKLKFERVLQSFSVSFGDHLYDFMAKVPTSTPFLTHLLFEAGVNNNSIVLQAPDAIHYQAGIDNIPCLDLEFSFKVNQDFSNVIEEVNYIVKRIYEEADKNNFPVNLTAEFRINKSSRCLLATSYDKDPNVNFVMLEILSVNGTKGFQEFSIELAKRWMQKFDAQPHWAKLWEYVPDIIPHIRKCLSVDDRLNRFEKVRAKYDPGEYFFDNKNLREVFGK